MFNSFLMLFVCLPEATVIKFKHSHFCYGCENTWTSQTAQRAVKSDLSDAAGGSGAVSPVGGRASWKEAMDTWRRDSRPRCSMYGLFTYIWVIFGVNVGKYSIHGASGRNSWESEKMAQKHLYKRPMVDHHSHGKHLEMFGGYGYHEIYYTWKIHMENMDVWWIILHGYIWYIHRKKWWISMNLIPMDGEKSHPAIEKRKWPWRRVRCRQGGHCGIGVLMSPIIFCRSFPACYYAYVYMYVNKPRIRNLPRIRNKESGTKSRESETKIRESETKIPRIRNQKSRESETKMRESETKLRESETENQKLKTANQKLKSRESETKLPRIRNQNPANQKPKTANQKPKPENQKLKNTREQVRFDWGNRQTVTLGLFRYSWVNHILNKQLLNTCHSMKAATLSNGLGSAGHYVE